MEAANKIYFTKLGTVKRDGEESILDANTSYQDFFRNLRERITKNVDHYSVIHNEEDDSYKILVTDSKERLYVVYYGDKELNKDNQSEEVSRELKVLADLTKEKEEELRKKREEEKSEREKTKEAVDKGNKGVFDSIEDKERYIDYLKKAIVEKKKNIRKDASNYSKSKYTYGGTRYSTHFFVGFLDLALSVALYFILQGAGVFATEGFNLIRAAIVVKGSIDFTSLISNVIGFKAGGFEFFGSDSDGYDINYEDDFMMHSSTYLFVVGLLNAGIALKNAVSFIKNVIKTRSGFNRFKKESEIKIEALEKSLAKDRLYEKTKGKERAKAEEKVDVVQEAKTAIEQSIIETRREFNNMFEKIKQIVDSGKKRNFYEQLLKMVDEYQNKSKQFEQTGNHLAINQYYMNQMSSLGYNVDRQLTSERQQVQSNEEFDSLDRLAIEVAQEEHQSTR